MNKRLIIQNTIVYKKKMEIIMIFTYPHNLQPKSYPFFFYNLLNFLNSTLWKARLYLYF